MTRAQQNIQEFLSSIDQFDEQIWDTCTSYCLPSFGNVEVCRPTPEQLQDDGRVDGVPIRCTEELRAQHESSIREMEAFWNANPQLTALGEPYVSPRSGGGTCIPIRCVETKKVYPSTAAAARAMGVNVNTFWVHVRLGKPAAGYHWKPVKRRAA